jgi:hypothetical protein
MIAGGVNTKGSATFCDPKGKRVAFFVDDWKTMTYDSPIPLRMFAMSELL